MAATVLVYYDELWTGNTEDLAHVENVRIRNPLN